MNVEQVFKRFFTDWQKFLMMGLGPLIINLVVIAVGFILILAMVGPMFINLIRAETMGMAHLPGMAFGMIGSFVGVFIVMMVMGLVAYALTNAGLIGSVVGYRRGEDVSLSSFWGYATRYFGKMLLLGLVIGVIMLVSMIMLIIPIIGWIAFFIWAPTAVVVLGIYPAYLIISQGYGIGDALGVGFKVLTSQFSEALISGLIMLGFGIAMGMAGMVPILGWIVATLFGQPLFTYFFIERFEAEVRPKLQI